MLTAEGHLDSRSKLWILATLFGALCLVLVEIYSLGLKSIAQTGPRLFVSTGILICAGLSTFATKRLASIGASQLVDSVFAAVHWLAFAFFGCGSAFLIYLFATGERSIDYLGLAAVSLLTCIALAPFGTDRSIAPKIGIVVSGFCLVVFLISGSLLVALTMGGAVALTGFLFLAWKRP